MKKPTLSRRLLAGAAGLAIGLGGLLAVSTPAHATVAPEPGPEGQSGSIVHECDGVVVTITLGQTHRKWKVMTHGGVFWQSDGLLDGREVADPAPIEIPAREAGDVTIKWWSEAHGWTELAQTHMLEDDGRSWEMPEHCEVPDPVEAVHKCDSLILKITNHREGDDAASFDAIVHDGEEATVVTVEPGKTKDVVVEAEEGTVVTVAIGEGGWVIAWEEPEGCDEPATEEEDNGGAGELPKTGVQSALIAGGALVLLTLGGAMYLVARRRRITFTA